MHDEGGRRAAAFPYIRQQDFKYTQLTEQRERVIRIRHKQDSVNFIFLFFQQVFAKANDRKFVPPPEFDVPAEIPARHRIGFPVKYAMDPRKTVRRVPPTARTVFSVKSSIPPKGSKSDGVRYGLYARALIVKSRLDRSSMISDRNTTWLGCRKSRYSPSPR